MGGSPAARPPRSDAIRNRQRLLEAATRVFTDNGIDASVAEIADLAGVGKGTVFRHFPTKEHLMVAVVCRLLDSLTEIGSALAEEPDSEAALWKFMDAGVAAEVADKSFCQAAGRIVGQDKLVLEAIERLHRVADELVDRARTDKVVREEITGRDVVSLLPGVYHAAAAAAGEPVPGMWHRYLEVVFDGLRPQAGKRRLHSAPDADNASGSRQ